MHFRIGQGGIVAKLSAVTDLLLVWATKEKDGGFSKTAERERGHATVLLVYRGLVTRFSEGLLASGAPYTYPTILPCGFEE